MTTPDRRMIATRNILMLQEALNSGDEKEFLRLLKENGLQTKNCSLREDDLQEAINQVCKAALKKFVLTADSVERLEAMKDENRDN